jgi:hypothetical protein
MNARPQLSRAIIIQIGLIARASARGRRIDFCEKFTPRKLDALGAFAAPISHRLNLPPSLTPPHPLRTPKGPESGPSGESFRAVSSWRDAGLDLSRARETRWSGRFRLPRSPPPPRYHGPVQTSCLARSTRETERERFMGVAYTCF